MVPLLLKNLKNFIDFLLRLAFYIPLNFLNRYLFFSNQFCYSINLFKVRNENITVISLDIVKLFLYCVETKYLSTELRKSIWSHVRRDTPKSHILNTKLNIWSSENYWFHKRNLKNCFSWMHSWVYWIIILVILSLLNQSSLIKLG